MVVVELAVVICCWECEFLHSLVVKRKMVKQRVVKHKKEKSHTHPIRGIRS